MAIWADINVTADTGAGDGTITLVTHVSTSLAGAVFTFLWNDGVTTQNRTGLINGEYFVQIRYAPNDGTPQYISYYINVITEYVNFLSHLRCCYSDKVWDIIAEEEEGGACESKQEAHILWDIIEQLKCSSFNDPEQCLTNDQMQTLIGKASLICGCPPIQILPPDDECVRVLEDGTTLRVLEDEGWRLMEICDD